MFQHKQSVKLMQREYNCKEAYYPNQRCLGSILVLFQVLLLSVSGVLPWCAVIRMRSCENNA